MRIRTSGDYEWRLGLYDDVGALLDENTRSGAIDASCLFTRQMLPVTLCQLAFFLFLADADDFLDFTYCPPFLKHQNHGPPSRSVRGLSMPKGAISRYADVYSRIHSLAGSSSESYRSDESEQTPCFVAFWLGSNSTSES